ncbi:MAG: cell division protein FtsZ [Treponema sp.]|nr:cell division protein FtsZ [Treponema sp.]
MGNLGIQILDEESNFNAAYAESSPTVIKVVGCGGGGSNAVNRMISHELNNVDFIVLNTDLQALGRSNAPTKLAIGQKVTKGLGAGGRPEVGEQAAEEDKELITNELRGADMVFITAGMGGGTGTGSAPVVARIAKELGCLTVAVVTTPFVFEGNVRMRQAKEGLKKLHAMVDSMIVIPNEQLFNTIDKNTTVKESFRRADEILCQGVEGISNIITNPGDVNTDFADVRNAMSGQGNAIFGIGIAEGENRAADAAYAAINNPMLEDSHIDGAKNILVNICASEEISLSEVGEICKIVTASADKDYNMFWGQVTQPDLGGKISVTVIATGFEQPEPSTEEVAAEEKTVEKTPVEYSENVMRSSELSGILHPSNKLGGDFVSRKEFAAMAGKANAVSQPAAQRVPVTADAIEPKKEDKQSGSLGRSLFEDTEPSIATRAVMNRFSPPEGYKGGNDINQPAIWSSMNFGRGINLSD